MIRSPSWLPSQTSANSGWAVDPDEPSFAYVVDVYGQPGEFFAGSHYLNKNDNHVYLNLGKSAPVLFKVEGWTGADTNNKAHVETIDMPSESRLYPECWTGLEFYSRAVKAWKCS